MQASAAYDASAFVTLGLIEAVVLTRCCCCCIVMLLLLQVTLWPSVSPVLLYVVISLIKPQNYDWALMKEIPTIEDDANSMTEDVSVAQSCHIIS